MTAPLAPSQPRTPKLRRTADRRWFRYYAGFSPAFVSQSIDSLALPPGSMILDPWNGSGTTTATAFMRGFRSLGVDLNPVSTVIARSRVIAPSGIEALDKEFSFLQQEMRSARYEKMEEPDPLDVWFDRRSARTIRQLERIVRTHLGFVNEGPLPPYDLSDRVASDGAVLYLALFKSVRNLLLPFATRNPTWIRVPKNRTERLVVSKGEVLHSLAQAFREVTAAADWESVPQYERRRAAPRLLTQDIVEAPLRKNQADAVITSPPYCTRIDYVRATMPELAVLGWGGDDRIKYLRDRMLGSPTIDSTGATRPEVLPESVLKVLETISAHPSKAANSYYRPNLQHYFELLSRSLRNLRHAVRPEGPAVLVVQDSYFKDVHIDLPGLLSDIAQQFEWQQVARWDYDVVRSMAAVNVGAKVYRQSSHATEAAVILR